MIEFELKFNSIYTTVITIMIIIIPSETISHPLDESLNGNYYDFLVNMQNARYDVMPYTREKYFL